MKTPSGAISAKVVFIGDAGANENAQGMAGLTTASGITDLTLTQVLSAA